MSDRVDRRSAQPNLCDHRGPTSVELAGRDFRVRCIRCGKAGPVRKTPEAALKALLVLGVWDGSRQEGGRVAGGERLWED